MAKDEKLENLLPFLLASLLLPAGFFFFVEPKKLCGSNEKEKCKSVFRLSLYTRRELLIGYVVYVYVCLYIYMERKSIFQFLISVSREVSCFADAPISFFFSLLLYSCRVWFNKVNPQNSIFSSFMYTKRRKRVGGWCRCLTHNQTMRKHTTLLDIARNGENRFYTASQGIRRWIFRTPIWWIARQKLKWLPGGVCVDVGVNFMTAHRQ